MKLYRVMKVDTDGRPLVGRRRNMLGVRPTDPNSRDPRRVSDVRAVNDADPVLPGEGLSASTDRHAQLRRVGRPEAVFEIDPASFPPVLSARRDRGDHWLIEPTVPMTLAEFLQALIGTRDSWHRI